MNAPATANGFHPTDLFHKPGARSMTNPPKTDAERQAQRRQRRKEEMDTMRAALRRIAEESTDAKARAIAIKAMMRDTAS